MGFEAAVSDLFNFLLSDYQYSVVHREPTLVRFESDKAFLNVYQGRRSYELGVELGLLSAAPGSPAGSSFDLREIIELLGDPADARLRTAATTPDVVRTLLAKLASLVKRYAGPALLSEPGIFERLAERRKFKSVEYAKRMELEDVRAEADRAWHSKDFRRVVELLEPLAEQLTPLEIKKLRYAKNRN